MSTPAGSVAVPINRAVLREVAAWKLRELLYYAGDFWRWVAAAEAQQWADKKELAPDAELVRLVQLGASMFVIHWRGWESYCTGIGHDPSVLLSMPEASSYLQATLPTATDLMVPPDEAAVILAQATGTPQGRGLTAVDTLLLVGQEYQRIYERHYAIKPGRRQPGRQN